MNRLATAMWKKIFNLFLPNRDEKEKAKQKNTRGEEKNQTAKPKKRHNKEQTKRK